MQCRRFAILDDNQRLIEQRLLSLSEQLPALLAGRVCAAMVIGSVAGGQARDGSDIDLLLVLTTGTPRRIDYRWWDDEVEPKLDITGRFPVEPLFIGPASLHTREPHLRAALASGLSLWDPEGLFDDQS